MASGYLVHTLTTLLILPFFLITVLVGFPIVCFIRVVMFLYRVVVNENLRGKVVLITGASSGIGEELAYEYARRGSSLVIVARRENQLQKVAANAKSLGSPDVLCIKADVSNVDDCKRFVDETVKHFGRLDHLVNNAGIPFTCNINDMTDITKFTPVMDVNFWGSVYPTYFAIPHLKRTGGKVFVNASSVAHLHPPSLSFYTASKAALISFYETMRLELAPEISITIATLGYIDTKMIRGKHSKDKTMKVESENVVLFPAISSSDCAKSIVGAICRKDRYVTEPKYFGMFFFLKSVLPEVVEWFHRTITPELCTGATQAKKF